MSFGVGVLGLIRFYFLFHCLSEIPGESVMDGVLGSETESHVIMDGTVNIFHGERDGVLVGSAAKPEKLIIDTDPGIGEFFSFSPSIK